jgi:hypothetical protein
MPACRGPQRIADERLRGVSDARADADLRPPVTLGAELDIAFDLEEAQAMTQRVRRSGSASRGEL